MSAKALLSASVSAGPAAYVEDVFSTYLYTGNGSTQTITNGIDLSGEGGLVWLKKRSDTDNHVLIDTERWDSTQNFLSSNTTSSAGSSANGITSFNSDGFSLSGSLQGTNSPGAAQASWTFRKAEKFFDVVTYTGSLSNLDVSHNLGSVPGCIIIKQTNGSSNWFVWHRSTTDIFLNLTNAALGSQNEVGNVTSSSFRVFYGATNTNLDASATYVAYVFAHDAGGFGDAGTDSVVSCGTFSRTFGTANSVNLGYEPQWVLIKCTTQADSWQLYDTMRGLSQTASLKLEPNTANSDVDTAGMIPTATGFDITATGVGGGTFIYIAIRRGPMKTPESGTEVFSPQTATYSTNQVVTTGFPVDMLMMKGRTITFGTLVYDRLRGLASTNTSPYDAQLLTSDTSAESAGDYTNTANNTGYQISAGFSGFSSVNYNFRRAPGFFDVVAYTGTGTTQNVQHNLGVAPQLIINKSRSADANFGWTVYAEPLGNSQVLRLNDSSSAGGSGGWDSTSPTATQFTLNGYNNNSVTYIAYLFATAPGVSKVGSYTGTGTTLSIDCGFTAGARFVMIKRTDSTGDWYVWDTARGIISGDDPYLLLNSTAAEVTNTDYIDPLSSGFQISSTAPAAINASGGSFIFLAIA